jgi:hypothetical protein
VEDVARFSEEFPADAIGQEEVWVGRPTLLTLFLSIFFLVLVPTSWFLTMNVYFII